MTFVHVCLSRLGDDCELSWSIAAREPPAVLSTWKSTMKRVLCVWFPHWPLQRVCLVQPELKGRPVVLYGPARVGSTRVGSTRANSSAQRGDWLVVHCA